MAQNEPERICSARELFANRLVDLLLQAGQVTTVADVGGDRRQVPAHEVELSVTEPLGKVAGRDTFDGEEFAAQIADPNRSGA